MNSEAALVPVAPQLPAASEQGLMMPAHVAAVVPPEHHEVWNKLPIAKRARVSELLTIFEQMTTAPEGVVSASNRIGRRLTAEGRKGFSGVNLRTLFYAFRDAEKEEKGSGWLTLAKIYKGPAALPKEFVQEVRRRIEANQVSARAAITALRADWADGASIPGYGTWRDYFRTIYPLEDVPERFPLNFYPAGWSESNLYSYQSSKAERALKRGGFAFAKKHLPHVMRDLSKLRFLELIVIDDFETDQLVLAWNPETKRWQICRCAGLVAIDAATRCKLAIGLKPRFTDDEGKKMSLTRADVQSLLHSVFSTWGLPADYGCTILCENGGAAITSDFELALSTLINVQVARTGLIHEKTLKNGFVQSGGKPWEKPWIESMFRLMHSTAGALPGQKGATYQLKPADLEAKVLYAEKLLNTEGLPAEAAEQMRVPFLKVDQFFAAYERIFERMETRTDHKLQGFESRFMFMLPDGRTVGEGNLALMAPDDVKNCTPLPVMESPRERLARLATQCRRVKVAEAVLACLLLTPKKIVLKNHRLTFSHQAKGYTFADADSEVMKLPEGTEVLGYFDPARPGVLHVTDLKGAYLGPVRSRNRVDIRDSAAIANEQAEVSRLIHACVVGPVRDRHAAEDAQLLADRQHNEALLRQHNLLPDAAPKAAAGHNDQSQAAHLAPALTERAPAKQSQRPATLSQQLRHAPARDAFGTFQQKLAEGIAAQVGAADAAQAREAEVRRQSEAMGADDLKDLCNPGTQPVQAPADDPGSLSDLL